MNDSGYYKMIKEIEDELLAIKQSAQMPLFFKSYVWNVWDEYTGHKWRHYRITFNSSEAAFINIIAANEFSLRPQNGNTQDLYMEAFLRDYVFYITSSSQILSVDIIDYGIF